MARRRGSSIVAGVQAAACMPSKPASVEHDVETNNGENGSARARQWLWLMTVSGNNFVYQRRNRGNNERGMCAASSAEMRRVFPAARQRLPCGIFGPACGRDAMAIFVGGASWHGLSRRFVCGAAPRRRNAGDALRDA